VDFLREYYYWLLVSAPCGIVNVIAAWWALDKECKGFPFFYPYKIKTFWIWIFFEFAIPVGGFWVFLDLIKKPPTDIILYLKSLTFGVGFTTLVNSSLTEIGPFNYDAKSIHTFFVKMVKQSINYHESPRNADFWSSFKTELRRSNDSQLFTGIQFLEICVKQDISINVIEKTKLLDKINSFNDIIERNEKVEKIFAFIMSNLIRKHLPSCLKNLDCNETLTSFYFNKSQANLFGKRKNK
jgi:hypothetical protein